MAPPGRRQDKGGRGERVLVALERAQSLASTLSGLDALSAAWGSAVWDSYSQCEYAIGLLRLDLPEEPFPGVLKKRAKELNLAAATLQVPVHLKAAIGALRAGDKLRALALSREARDSLRHLFLATRDRIG